MITLASVPVVTVSPVLTVITGGSLKLTSPGSTKRQTVVEEKWHCAASHHKAIARVVSNIVQIAVVPCRCRSAIVGVVARGSIRVPADWVSATSP